MLMSSAATATVATAARAATATSIRRDGPFPESEVPLLMIAPYQNGMSQRGCRLGVSHRTMAARTFQPLCFSVDDIPINRCRDVLMAAAAGVLDNFMIELRDLDRVGIPAGGEVKRVP